MGVNIATEAHVHVWVSIATEAHPQGDQWLVWVAIEAGLWVRVGLAASCGKIGIGIDTKALVAVDIAAFSH